MLTLYQKEAYMPPTLFTLSEAQELQSQDVQAVEDYQDEFGRIIIPQGCTCRVVGIDAWSDEDATIAVQSNGLFPRVVLLNKTNYEHYFENLSASPIAR
jgi:hypothetical protein